MKFISCNYNKNTPLFVTVIILAFSFLNAAMASSSFFNEGKLIHDADEFITLVYFFDQYETTQSTYEKHAALSFLISEALAQGQSENDPCLIAGYVGTTLNHHCVYPHDKLFTSQGKVVCNPDIFGKDVIIERPKDNRWTLACANELLKTNGMKSSVDAFDPTEKVKLGATLLAKKVKLEDSFKKANALCTSIQKSSSPTDASDCKILSNAFNPAAMGASPSTVANESEQNSKSNINGSAKPGTPCHEPFSAGSTFYFAKGLAIDKDVSTLQFESGETGSFAFFVNSLGCEIKRPSSIKSAAISFSEKNSIVVSSDFIYDNIIAVNQHSPLHFRIKTNPIVNFKEQPKTEFEVDCHRGAFTPLLEDDGKGKVKLSEIFGTKVKFDPATTCPPGKTSGAQETQSKTQSSTKAK